MRIWLIGCLISLSACGAPPPPLRVPAESPEPWLTSLDRPHPLVGKIWDAKASAFVDLNQLAARAATARFVLLGERHDNPDHHRLQARVLSELVKNGRHPAVVLEMLEIEQQPAIDSYVAQPGANAAGFGAALGWEKTSWPPFADYQPIFEVAFASTLPIKAGNVAQADAKALVRQGVSSLSSERAQQLRLDRDLPAPLEAPLLDELRASHCGQLPENMLKPMVLAQRARDAQMALVLESTAAEEGAVLIAGGGHARR